MISSKVSQEKTGDLDRLIAEITVAARSERFAAQFTDVNDEMIAIVTNCSLEQWRQPCPGEGWPVGVVAHHVASVLPAFIKIVERVAAGVILVPRISMDSVNESNARHAHAFSDVSQDEVVDLLRTQGSTVTRVLRDLTDEQLARTTIAFGGQERSLAEIIEKVVIGHSRQHLASLRATLAD